MMTSSFGAAMEAIDRSAATPAGFCRPFVDLFPVTGASVSTVGNFLGSETLSASDDIAARLDELQFDLGEGPCWDAVRSGRAVLEPDFARGRVADALARVLAAAMSDVDAALDLRVPARGGAAADRSSRPLLGRSGRPRPEPGEQADAMAGAIGRHVLRQALGAVGRDYDYNGNAYSRRVVHQATGMVLAQLDISADDARLVIQGHAFAASRSMMEVAQDILDGRIDFADESDSGSRPWHDRDSRRRPASSRRSPAWRTRSSTGYDVVDLLQLLVDTCQRAARHHRRGHPARGRVRGSRRRSPPPARRAASSS